MLHFPQGTLVRIGHAFYRMRYGHADYSVLAREVEPRRLFRTPDNPGVTCFADNLTVPL